MTVEQFLNIALSFPTVVFSFVLAVMVVYWLIALLGLVDIDVLDNLTLPDGDGLELEGLSGLLMRLGLAGIPLTVILTVLAFFSWFVSYYAVYLLQGMGLDGWPSLALGIAVLPAAFVAGVMLTSLALRPLRRLLGRIAPRHRKSLLGQVGVVRSPTVNAQQGYVAVEDGGAGLILQARSPNRSFQRGDRVVLIEYRPDMNHYLVIGEEEFTG